MADNVARYPRTGQARQGETSWRRGEMKRRRRTWIDRPSPLWKEVRVSALIAVTNTERQSGRATAGALIRADRQRPGERGVRRQMPRGKKGEGRGEVRMCGIKHEEWSFAGLLVENVHLRGVVARQQHGGIVIASQGASGQGQGQKSAGEV